MTYAADEEGPNSLELKIKENFEAISGHVANTAYLKWDALHTVWHVQRGNRILLLNFLSAPREDEELALKLISNLQDTELTKSFFIEVVRLLHNYLASVSSLIDHSRNLLKNYQDYPFQTEYINRVSAIKDAGTGPTLKDLRSYLLHNAVPPLAMKLSISNNMTDHRFDVELDTSELLKWRKWRKEAKQYLAKLEKLNLRACVREYSSSICSVYKWLFDQFGDVHQEDIRDLNRLLSEKRRMMPSRLTRADMDTQHLWGPFD